MESSRFDQLTKALATSTSRRQALGRIGGTFVGSVLAAWPFSQVLAAGGGNSACAHFCAAVFGADTPAAKQCTSDAAHHKGLCYTCGPAAPTGHPPLCGQVCCASGQICGSSGTCVTPPSLQNTFRCVCSSANVERCVPNLTCSGSDISQACHDLCLPYGGEVEPGVCLGAC